MKVTCQRKETILWKTLRNISIFHGSVGLPSLTLGSVALDFLLTYLMTVGDHTHYAYFKPNWSDVKVGIAPQRGKCVSNCLN